ncbi:MAG: type II toxin-antitoxin system death-on-curing family toxin [Alphaproteobacteria bacterium]|nr:type II toxin-antitoxin system death-on-curing family toxin [Alphaproteobacteria bacterium]
MSDYKWLTDDAVKAMHEQLIAAFGGTGGIRDEGLLASALARPKQIVAYGEPTVPRLAAAYAYGIARNHPFVDGNKRSALMAAYTFLRINGFALAASEVETVAVIRDLAADEIDEDALARWIAANTSPLDV